MIHGLEHLKENEKPENPYCMRCGKHLGMSFHETNEHDEAEKIQNRLKNL